MGEIISKSLSIITHYWTLSEYLGPAKQAHDINLEMISPPSYIIHIVAKDFFVFFLVPKYLNGFIPIQIL